MSRTALLVPTVLAAALLILFIGSSAKAGPPCLCWPIETEAGDKLALGGNEPVSAARAAQVAQAALVSERSLFAHMEILRRASLVIGRDLAARDALLAGLAQRVLDGEAAGKTDGLAWFDAAYAQACFQQLGARHLDGGVPWMRRAIETLGDDPRAHFAAALIALDASGGDLEAHQAAAERAAPKDALLARNLELFRGHAGLEKVSPVAKKK